MFRRLPPAGSPVLLKPISDPESCFASVFKEQAVFFYGTGTMALAAALIVAKTRSGVDKPEVLLPAYACPDLISAAVYAGVKPVLVDFELDKPWMNLTRLQEKLNSRTIAVIAVHFLGIAERLGKIREVLAGSNVLLIEDSAQLFPRTSTNLIWQGDLIILSFGRGKPVSLLGGGAVICRNSSLAHHFPRTMQCSANDIIQRFPFRYIVKSKIYNQLRSPRWYAFLNVLPFLHLGETRYKPLRQIDAPFEGFLSILASNIDGYLRRDMMSQSMISNMLMELQRKEIYNLPVELGNDSALPLLRYPVLLQTSELREMLYIKLSREGLGVSRMYITILPKITGLSEMFSDQGDFPQAEAFSEKLLTFPCHSDVTNRDVKQIRSIIEHIINI